MNTNFIRLHNVDTNTVVVVNINYITCIDSENNEGKVVSRIYTNSSSDINEFEVNETPEKIFDMINKLGETVT